MQFLLTGVKLAVYLLCVHYATKMGHNLRRIVMKYASRYNRMPFPRLFECLVVVVPLAPAIVITIVFAIAFELKPMAALGLQYNANSLAFVGIGVLVGCACVAVIVVSGILMGFIRVRRSRKDSEDTTISLSVFLGFTDFFAGAIYEEIITRGYIFYVFYQTFGSGAAVLGSAILFLLAHFTYGGVVRPLFIVNALIFGVVTALCRLHTGALWLPIGLHLGWNIMECPVLGLPYSGKAYRQGIMNSDVSGPEWFTGGTYSPDSGVLGTLGLILAVMALNVLVNLV